MDLISLLVVPALAIAVYWYHKYLTAREELRRYKALCERITKRNSVLTDEITLAQSVMFDVAIGEADVWIEDGELRAARCSYRNLQRH